MSQVHLEINNLYSALESPEEATTLLFETILQSGAFPIAVGDLSIAFVDDGRIARIHAEFMDDPSPTDVITFPADPSMESAGEIIVSVDHARKNAREHGFTFSRELTLYLVHGWLHLSGHDDRTEAARAKMRSAEQEALALLDSAQKTPCYRLNTE